MVVVEPVGTAPAVQTAVPLTILTGFLGAGKTTLLNRMLSSDHGLRMAVLVNDFGAVNIDAELVIGVEDDMMSLANGCICCQIRDDLVEAVDRVLMSEHPPEYIVLEASGIADPASIYSTFADSELRDRIRLDSVTCVVDAEQIFEHLEEAPGLLMLKARQIACADLVVLNKVGLAGPEQVQWVRDWIDSLMNRVRIIESDYCDVPFDVLLGVGRFAVAGQLDAVSAVSGDANELDHGAQFQTWSFESDQPFSLEALEEMIKRELPGSVYRCKGVISIAGADERFALQVVGRRAEVERLDAWGSRTPRSRVVVIGAAGKLNEAELGSAFEGCLAAS